jgi:2-polyprenyl-3-methyl-5-hydroxy-6-metoxy-1,4-benzoquinol methylase
MADGGVMIDYVSPASGLPLREEGGSLVSGSGERFPVVGGIPRFVSSDNYAAAFGVQWKAFAKTQLDSHSKTRISRERLQRCVGSELSALKGKTVLEAGCGAGRFTELLVESGARIHAIDLSVAVEANRENVGEHPNYRVAQASLLTPPFPKASFDLVICLGVLQHLPSPEEGIRSLWSMVKPGGSLVIDHYLRRRTPIPVAADIWRFFLKRMSPPKALKVSNALVRFFFPLHWALRRSLLAQRVLCRISPVIVYFHIYPELTPSQQYEFSRLDTYDSVTDYYKRGRSVEEIARACQSLGATDILASKGGNGVEARCRKPGGDGTGKT